MTTTSSNFAFTDEDYTSKSKAYPTLVEGTMKAVVVSATNKDAKATKNMQLGLTLVPLDGDDLPQKELTAGFYIAVPKANPKVDGHQFSKDPEKIKQAKNKIRSTVRAFDPDLLPRSPFTKTDDGWRTLNGEPVTSAMWDERNTTDAKLYLGKFAEWYNDPNQLIGKVVYMTIKQDFGNKDKTQISYLSADGGGKPVITSDFVR